MTTFLDQFTPEQLALVTARATITEKAALSATGAIVAGDDLGEVYLDDANALFVTAGIDAGDIVEITAGAASPLGHYTVAGQYLDPKTDASVAEPSETRLILDGAPTVADPVTYRVYAAAAILEDLASITENRSRIENVTNLEIQAMSDIFTAFQDKFNLVCDLVANEHRWLNGVERSRVTAGLLATAALVTVPNVLFPEEYFELQPNRSTVFPLYPPIDPFTITGQPNSEREGSLEEDSESGGLGPTDPLTGPYEDALDKQEAALNLQRAALLALQAEIVDNDAGSEAGDLTSFYTALSASVAQALSDTQDRLDDIDTIRTADRARPHVLGLNNPDFVDVLADIDARAAQLEAAPYTAFLDLRYTYLDLLVNRAFGLLTELAANTQQVAIDQQRRATLLADLNTERDLLGLP